MRNVNADGRTRRLGARRERRSLLAAAAAAALLFVACATLLNDPSDLAGGAAARCDGADCSLPDAAVESSTTDAADAADAPTCPVDPIDASGLVAYYPLDEERGATVRDCSGKVNDGTLLGGAGWDAGRVRGGLVFDGTSTCLDLGTSTDFQLGSSYTIAAWTRVKEFLAGPASRFIASKSVLSGEDGWTLATDGPNAFQFRISRPDAGTYGLTRTNQPANVWLHLAVVVQPPMGGVLYVDGQPVAGPSAAPGIVEDGARMLLGCKNTKGTSANFYSGALDEVRIYRRALALDEITKLADPGR